MLEQHTNKPPCRAPVEGEGVEERWVGNAGCGGSTGAGHCVSVEKALSRWSLSVSRY